MKYNIDDIPFVIGQRIKTQRIVLGLTQEKLADQINCSSKTIVNYESGQLIPLEKMLKLCDVLQCDMGYLLGEYEAPTRTIADVQSALELSNKTIEKLSFNYEDRLCFFDYFVKNADLVTDYIFDLQNLHKTDNLLANDEYHEEILKAFKESGADAIRRKAGLYYSTKEERNAEHLFKEKLTEILKEKLSSGAENIAEWKSNQYFKVLFNAGFTALRSALQSDFMQLVDGYIKETTENLR